MVNGWGAILRNRLPGRVQPTPCRAGVNIRVSGLDFKIDALCPHTTLYIVLLWDSPQLLRSLY